MIPYKNPDPARPMRIAIRTEGQMVNAYIVADIVKMQKLVSSFDKAALDNDELLFNQWKQLLTDHLLRWMTALDLNVSAATIEEHVPGQPVP